MIGNVYSAKQEQSLDLYFQIYGFGNDRDKYLSFKKGKLISFNYGNDIGFNIMMILEKLGFSIDDLGTYAFKNLIKKLVYMINDGIDEDTIIKSLMKAYSQLYLDVAYDTDVGTQTFHNYIETAFMNRNLDKFDEDLAFDIFDNYQGVNHGIDAYMIAKYVNNVFNLYMDKSKVKTFNRK